LKLARCPHSLTAPLAALPSMSPASLAASSASRQRGKERSATPANLHATCREPELTRARPLDLNHNTRFHVHIRLSIYVFDGYRLICPLSQGAHPNSHRAMQSSQRLDSLTPASSPVRVTHLCRTASRWLHSQHAVLPLQIYLRRAFIHIYVYPYIYLSESVYVSFA